ncbi:NADPH-dependent FMN reductase [Actinotalea sp.]|uniref:NADPH-dependent FMN reductase n=1 Tax=Actinotalea sp. TaxID=1872145 RepID=UPI0035644308
MGLSTHDSAAPEATVVLVGNPRPGSRTARAALRVAEVLTPDATPRLVDLAVFGPAVLDPDSPEVAAAMAEVAAARLLVVASPVYKGAATGLLKAFLDRYGPEALRGVIAQAVMVGASPAHAPAVETTLRPVLVELGAVCPVTGLYLREQVLEALGTDEDPVTAWADTFAWPLHAALDHRVLAASA